MEKKDKKIVVDVGKKYPRYPVVYQFLEMFRNYRNRDKVKLQV